MLSYRTLSVVLAVACWVNIAAVAWLLHINQQAIDTNWKLIDANNKLIRENDRLRGYVGGGHKVVLPRSWGE